MGKARNIADLLNSSGKIDSADIDSSAQFYQFKNRIINGAMMIDQRNAGASVTADGNTVYGVDRFASTDNTDGSFTVQQSSTAPTGFNKSLLFTVASTDASLSSGQYARFLQSIEGLNVADLGWGTANASTVTLSFWVRSSVTGTFGAGIRNSAGNRGYPFSYTINSANTFEYKTVTIAGDTTGTWLTTNGIGLDVVFALGAGTDYQSTANTWGAGNYYSVSGATNLMATSGATFYITGVQLEKGSTATSFDYRPYGTEELLCKRYYTKFSSLGATYVGIGCGVSETSTGASIIVKYPVTMRSAPTASQSTTGLYDGTSVKAITSLSTNYQGSDCLNINVVASGGGLTTGRGTTFIVNNSTTGYFDLNAEL